ncbi:MAG TPA: DoxX family protein [Terriglobales bacterium]|nr:DoxX family protein [Terriglobales bacterium]
MGVTKARSIAYWTCTTLVAFVMTSGGFVNTFVEASIAGLVKLGYPHYFGPILGVWKMLAGIAILVPRFPRLKEWAYAGMTFELTGAAITNAVAGAANAGAGYVGHIAAPLVIAALALVSWALRPENRTLGVPVARWLGPKEGRSSLATAANQSNAALAGRSR